MPQVYSLASLTLYAHASRTFHINLRDFCLNLINLREIMSCMPTPNLRVRRAIVHEVFENVTPGHENL